MSLNFRKFINVSSGTGRCDPDETPVIAIGVTLHATAVGTN
jgi:hypothetical protein